MDNKTKMQNKFSNPLATGYDGIFGKALETPTNTEPNNIATQELFPFGYYDEERAKMHIFTPYTPEKLDALAKDIQENGLLQPLLVRKRSDNEYEVLAGHNRLRAAKQANLDTVPCIVKECNDDEAIIIMTSTNLYQREEIPPCQKGKAYKLNLDAMNNQGKRTELFTDEKKGASAKFLSEQVGTSVATIYRLVRLTYLIDEFQEQIDLSNMSIAIGENLSYLTPMTQQTLLEVTTRRNKKIDLSLSESLKENFKGKDTTEKELREFIFPQKEDKEIAQTVTPKTKTIKVKLPNEVLERFTTNDEIQNIEELVKTLLEEYFTNQVAKKEVANGHQ